MPENKHSWPIDLPEFHVRIQGADAEDAAKIERAIALWKDDLWRAEQNRLWAKHRNRKPLGRPKAENAERDRKLSEQMVELTKTISIRKASEIVAAREVASRDNISAKYIQNIFYKLKPRRADALTPERR